MNNPLRFAGDTLYQSGYDPGPPETTALQVVKNVGWMIPYVGCMIVAVGMLAHFSLTLVRFLRRRDAEELAADEHVAPGRGGLGRSANMAREPGDDGRQAARKTIVGWTRNLPCRRLSCCCWPAGWPGQARTPEGEAEAQFDYYQFGKLPLLYEGRVKPFDTLARNSLLDPVGQADGSGRGARASLVEVLGHGKKHSAIEWLLDTVCHAPASVGHRVFLHPKPRRAEIASISSRARV